MRNTGILDLVNTITLGDLPKRLVRYVKEQILDAIGFSMAGAQEQAGQDRIGRLTFYGVLREATIIGDGAKISAIDAFNINSYLCHLGDYSEVGYHIPNHQGRLVVKATLAAGEKLDTSIGDVVVAALLTHELIKQALRVTWQVVWPENEASPDAKFIPYLDVPPIARILSELLSPRLNNDPNTIASLLMESLFILQYRIGEDIVKKSREKQALMDRTSLHMDTLKYSKGSWRNSLTRIEGMGPKLADHFLIHNALALEKAIHSRHTIPEFIKHIVLVYPIALDRVLCDKIDDLIPRMATAAAMYIFGARARQSWHLINHRSSEMVSRIAERIKLADDFEGYGELDSKGLPFRAHVHSFYGGIQSGRVVCPFMALREIDKRNASEWFKSNTLYLVGEKQSSELYEKLMNEESTPVAELLKLTRPTTWTLSILKKMGLLQ